MLCLDYSNLQGRRNISKLCMIARGYSFPVYGLWRWMCLMVFSTRESCFNRNIIGWNKISECHTKPMSATFCPCDHDFSQYTLPFASAIVAYQRELERVQYTEAIICRCFTKWMFLKFWQNSQDNTCAVIPFFNKVAGPQQQKRDSHAAIFL